MSDFDGTGEERGAGGSRCRAGNLSLELDTLERTRQDVADLTRAFLAGDVNDQTYRATIYGINSITKLLVHAKAGELEKRILKLEKDALKKHGM